MLDCELRERTALDCSVSSQSLQCSFQRLAEEMSGLACQTLLRLFSCSSIAGKTKQNTLNSFFRTVSF